MFKKLISIFIGVVMSLHCLASQPIKSEKVIINGKNIYYEVYGEGKPLFLLHGYAQSSIAWRAHVNHYIDDYQVYLVDLTGHGKSDAYSQTLSIKNVAKDLEQLIQYLKLKSIDALGFSYGGDVLYQLALMNPSMIKSMITIGSIGSWSIQDYPEVQQSFTYALAKNYSWIKDAHSSDEQVRILFDQFNHYSVLLSNDDLTNITSNVLIVAGDGDQGVPIKEIVRSRKYLPNSNLWIVPNVGHGGYDGENKQAFIRVSKAFLANSKTAL